MHFLAVFLPPAPLLDAVPVQSVSLLLSLSCPSQNCFYLVLPFFCFCTAFVNCTVKRLPTDSVYVMSCPYLQCLYKAFVFDRPSCVQPVCMCPASVCTVQCPTCHVLSSKDALLLRVWLVCPVQSLCQCPASACPVQHVLVSCLYLPSQAWLLLSLPLPYLSNLCAGVLPLPDLSSVQPVRRSLASA